MPMLSLSLSLSPPPNIVAAVKKKANRTRKWRTMLDDDDGSSRIRSEGSLRLLPRRSGDIIIILPVFFFLLRLFCFSFSLFSFLCLCLYAGIPTIECISMYMYLPPSYSCFIIYGYAGRLYLIFCYVSAAQASGAKERSCRYVLL
mmetsp:Transcript_28424/g.62496  ORF Transcript_28424/g.62496 Transcript_28424/m.62496 type:complete len:145 (-) Transcript_28424:166-600(-)